MPLDVVDLRSFYATPLGGMARRIIGQKIRAHWRRADGMVVIGIGYAAPYLGSFRNEALRLGAFMPAEQGGILWPSRGPFRSVMVEEDRLPLPDNTVDRLLLVHCLENAGGHARGLLREAWRVLAPNGRLLIVVPNRRGIWARRDNTPFGHGQPYSRAQLERLLVDALFTPVVIDTALYVPPLDLRLAIRAAPQVERIAGKVSAPFGGLLIVEARKEVASPIAAGAHAVHVQAVASPAPARRLMPAKSDSDNRA
jgi:SAM-dependent methyltransferase